MYCVDGRQSPVHRAQGYSEIRRRNRSSPNSNVPQSVNLLRCQLTDIVSIVLLYVILSFFVPTAEKLYEYQDFVLCNSFPLFASCFSEIFSEPRRLRYRSGRGDASRLVKAL